MNEKRGRGWPIFLIFAQIWAAAIAHWTHLRLLICGPVFESQAANIYALFNSNMNCDLERIYGLM